MLRLEHTGGLELDSTLDCGQCFRWSRTPAGWAGVVNGRSVLARMEGDTLLLEGPDETERDFWSRYFALDVDYPALLARYQAGNRRLAACVAENPGIRVLRQPFFETLCTFILSQNNNIPRIRGLVERLCALCGSPLENGQHAFPTPEQLAACTEEQLATLRAGWRAGYLADATQKVLGPLPGPEALTALPLADAQAALMTIHGVGPKVADCTLLYGLGPLGRLSSGRMDETGHGAAVSPRHSGVLQGHSGHCPAVHLCLRPCSSAQRRNAKAGRGPGRRRAK